MLAYRPSNTGLLHLAENGQSFCGRETAKSSQRSGDVCQTCRKIGQAQGYIVPASRIAGHDMGTVEANRMLKECAKIARSNA